MDNLFFNLWISIGWIEIHPGGFWIWKSMVGGSPRKKEEECLIPPSYNLPRDAGRAAGWISRLWLRGLLFFSGWRVVGGSVRYFKFSHYTTRCESSLLLYHNHLHLLVFLACPSLSWALSHPWASSFCPPITSPFQSHTNQPSEWTPLVFIMKISTGPSPLDTAICWKHSEHAWIAKEGSVTRSFFATPLVLSSKKRQKGRKCVIGDEKRVQWAAVHRFSQILY